MLTGQIGRSPNELEISQGLNMDLPAYQELQRELQGLGIGTLHSERFVDSGEEQLDLSSRSTRRRILYFAT